MIHAFTPESLVSWDGFASLTPFEQARLGPESKWLRTGQMRHFVLEEGGRPLARASVFVNPAMQDQAVPTGVIGCLDFEAAWKDNERGLEELVTTALGWLKIAGMKRVRGPIDFATWNRYRCMTDDWGYPPILGENVYDARYGRFFGKLLRPVGTYCSNLITDIEGGKQIAKLIKIDEAEARYGVRIEEIGREQAEPNLRMFYDMAMRIFPLDWSFAPIEFDEFAELLMPVVRQAPDLRFMVARDPAGAAIGLVYGYQNPYSTKKTAIVKTLGVVPEWHGKKVSYLLTYKWHLEQLEYGYQNFLHAMMKEDNRSQTMSHHFTTKVRGYSIYEGEL